MATNITMYSNNELSLLVFNNEYLYKSRFHNDFIDILKEYFIFTNDQLNQLKNDLNEDITWAL